MISVSKILALIAEKLPTNGGKNITARKLRDVVNPIASALPVSRLLLDESVTESHIGWPLMYDMENQKANLYVESEPIEGVAAKFLLTFTGGTGPSAGRKSLCSIKLVNIPTEGTTMTVHAGTTTKVYTFKEIPVNPNDIAIVVDLLTTVDHIKDKLSSDGWYFTYEVINAIEDDGFVRFTIWHDAATSNWQIANGAYYVEIEDGSTVSGGDEEDNWRTYFNHGIIPLTGGATRKLTLRVRDENYVFTLEDVFDFNGAYKYKNPTAEELSGGFNAYIWDYFGGTVDNIAYSTGLEVPNDSQFYIVCVDFPYMDSPDLLTASNMPVSIVQVTEQSPSSDGFADKVFIGVLDGIETEGLNKYAVIGDRPIRTFKLKYGDEFPMDDFNVNPSNYVVTAANNGLVRKIKRVPNGQDGAGVMGICLTKVVLAELEEGEDVEVLVKMDEDVLTLLAIVQGG